MIKIDGSILEGGGQILRIALSLSCLLKQPIHVFNIRAGRSKPGLCAQHLKGVHLLRDICSAKVEGDAIGSTKIKFYPNSIKGGQYLAHTGTAGSVALLLQVSLPVLLFSNKITTLNLKGGTNAAMAPQVDFLTEIFRPNLEKFGATFDFLLLKRGYFPQGGGECEVTIKPVKTLNPVTITEFGEVKRFFGWCFVSGVLPVYIAYKITDGAATALKTLDLEVPVELDSYKEDKDIAEGNCSGLNIGCETTTGCIIGSSGLGNREEKSFLTGNQAAMDIVSCVKQKACVDRYVQDQLIIFMALATGTSQIKTLPLTLHTKTAIHIVELMTNIKFEIIEEPNKTCIIQCTGIGYVNKQL